MIESLRALLSENGLTIEPEWNTEGYVRAESQWFLGKKWTHQGKDFLEATFGDFKTGTSIKWQSWDKATKAELTAANAFSKELKEKESALRLQVQSEVASQAQKDFEIFATTGTTPYLIRKNITELYGARIKENGTHDPILIVPLRDNDGALRNYQRIYSTKLSKGDKFFLEGALIEGCYHILFENGEPPFLETALETIYVCEGFATACAVKMATRSANVALTVAAFNAQNLEPVAENLKKKYPNAKLVICADNDAFTFIKGKQVNVGLIKARKAAAKVFGEIRAPTFKRPQKGFTDFNDLLAAEGLEMVKDQIFNPAKYLKDLQPMLLYTTETGKVIKPTEKQVTDHLLNYFGEKIIRQDNSIFVYNGRYWEELDAMGLDRIKQMIQVSANGLLGSGKISDVFRYFMIHAPQAPGEVDFFQPNPFVANFQNGTLHLEDKKLVFKPHHFADYLTSVLPFDCPPLDAPLARAPRFDAMVKRMWGKSIDQAQTIDLAHELIGACLMPAFPNITIFFGPPKSGKSTFIKLLVKLVEKENVCSVQLCDLNGFNMESMVGKLVNFDTDIDTNKPMNDSEVKKIIDRVPRRVGRKNKTDVYAYLPAVHLFAANQLPKSLDGSSHAYGRRFILIESKAIIEEERPEFDFETGILENEMEGVVARGLAGLKRLIENAGHYTVPESSREKVLEMENESDLIQQFVNDVKIGHVNDGNKLLEITTETDPHVLVERPQLWTIFNHWQDDAVKDQKRKVGKIRFFERLESKGFDAVKQTKTYHVKGFRLSVPGASL